MKSHTQVRASLVALQTIRFFAMFALMLSVANPALAQDIKGRVQVVDGDTLWLGRIKVRLNGVDAPERGRPRYRAATRALQSITAGKIVLCRLNGERSYDRYIGTCYVDGRDVAASVIASGNALDCARYSRGKYSQYETPDARRYIRQATYC